MVHSPLFLHVFPSFAAGGVPLRIVGFLNWLGSAYSHRVLSLRGDCGARAALDPKLDVSVTAFEQRGPLPLRILGQWRELRRTRPAALFTYNWGAIEWAETRNLFQPSLPHLHFESGFGIEEATRQLRRRVLMRRWVLRHASAVVLPSTTLVDLATNQWQIPADAIFHIPNGVDAARFDRAGDASVLDGFAGPNESIIGTVAPIRAEKSLDVLIRAFAKLLKNRPVKLVIVGDGPEMPRLKALVMELGIREDVLFTGHDNFPERIYPLFDVFALSSDTEQMPNVILQAMAARRPIAATAVGDIPIMVGRSNRQYLVPSGNSEALADAVGALLDAPDKARAIGEANRDKVLRSYSLDQMHATYYRLIQEKVHCES